MGEPDVNFPGIKTIPYQVQIEAYNRMKDHNNFALFLEQGLGKSVTLLADAVRSFELRDIESLVVLAPNGVYRNWSGIEIPKHLDIPHTVSIWSSEFTEIRQKKEWLKFCRHHDVPTLRIFVMNIEALSSERGKKAIQQIVAEYASMLVIDESTVIKNPQSQRTKAALKLRALSKQRRILTGSPIANKPFDMYAQAKFLGDELLGFDSFVTFKNFYANIIQINAGGRSFPKLLGYKNLDDFHRRIQPWSYRALKADWLDLPPKVYLSRDVAMSPEQEKAYQSMFDSWLIELKETSCTATIALTRLMRLHQVACGHVSSDDKTVTLFPQRRVSALLEALEESSGKSIIFAKYRQDVANIREALIEEYGRESFVEFHGDISKKDRELAVDRFQNEESVQYILCSYAASRGITLTAASNIVYYSYDYDRETRIQSEDRAHRIGQTKSVNIIDLKIPGTVDEVILASHKAKEALADSILDRVKLLTKQGSGATA